MERLRLREWLSKISVRVYILVCFFTISSWIAINGLWTELPLLVNELPESWNLPSYIIIITQVANIGPILYAISSRLFPNKVKEWWVIYVIILIGAAACLVLVFQWNKTGIIGGAKHSVWLLSLTAVLAIVDCTSTVVYIPYMANFLPQYMAALYLGEGMSSLVPGLVGLSQGVGGPTQCMNKSVVVHNGTYNYTKYEMVAVNPVPNFGVSIFFVFLFGIMVVSGAAFTFLHFCDFSRAEMVTNATQQHSAQIGATEGKSDDATSPLLGVNPSEQSLCCNLIGDRDPKDAGKLNLMQLSLMLAATSWLNGITNGILPSTETYTCLPYGGTAYSLANRLTSVVGPLVSFVALLLPTKSLRVIAVLLVVGTGLSAYQLVLAAMSPEPPLVHQVAGGVLVVLSSVALRGVFAYTKVALAYLFRHEGRNALLWYGCFTQVGSFVGAVLIFVLVNNLKLFKSAPPCG